MKKLTVIGLIFLTACTSPLTGGPVATPEIPVTPAVTATSISPTPVPATATETLVPTPTFTPEPPPRFFTEEFDGPSAYWSTLYASGGDVNIRNEASRLVFEFTRPHTWLYAIYGAQEYDTVHLEARVEALGSDINSMGLVCNYQEQKGWIEFNISTDGSYTILYGQWLGEGIAGYTPVTDGRSNYINTGSSTNEFGMDCLGDTLQLSFNGKLFRNIDVSRLELDGGKVGLAAASFEALPLTLAVDWVKVSEP